MPVSIRLRRNSASWLLNAQHVACVMLGSNGVDVWPSAGDIKLVC